MNTKMSTIQLVLLYVVSLAVEHFTVAQNTPADYLHAHNTARAQVAVGAMVWNTTVAAYAQNYANQMASTCNLAHSIGGPLPYGKNLASAGSSTFTGTEAVNLWVSEKQYYINSTRSCASGEVCSHYLQVIWPKSIHLGCARVVCNNNVGTLIICSYDPPGASAQIQCGREAGGAVCLNNFCCSRFGYCGETLAYCADGCQSQCRLAGATPTPTPSGGGGDLRSLIPQSLFNEMLKHRSDPACQGGFYTYDSFIAAAGSFRGFASVGDSFLRKREIAAFFAQTSHETTGGWPTAPDGPFAWGYCFIQEQGANPAEYCSPDAQFPCATNRSYFGRGPIQISWNYNYGQAGNAIGLDLLNNPDLVSSDPTISFKTALWFWMTPQSPKPSSHDVITGRWTPSDADKAAGRVPGFGVITNIINGGLECGQGANDRVANRIGFYKRYCNMLGVTPGDNLDCNNQRP